MEKEELQSILSEFKEEVVNLIGQQAQPQTQPQTQQPASPPAKDASSFTSATEGTAGGDDLVSKIVQALNKQTKDAENKVFDTMFEEKLQQLTRTYPAFGDYLNTADDFGETALSRIKSRSSYEDKIKAIDTVFRNFASAQNDSTADNIRLSKAVKKQVADDEAELDNIRGSFRKGEMSLDEFTEKWFSTTGKQLDKLRTGTR